MSSVLLPLFAAALLLAQQPPAQQTVSTQVVTPVTTAPVGGRPAPAAASVEPPVLPRDARLLVDLSGGQLIRQLQELQARYLQDQRPDDAAAVLAEIKLLQKVTGLKDDPAARVEAPKIYMNMYRDRVGQSFVFTITGSADETVWGTAVYTDDTALEGAAVHAGVLRSGQTGEVHVTVLPGQSKYEGSRRNGIESLSAASAGGSYRFGTGNEASVARPTSIAAFRGRTGDTVTVPVVGAVSGSVWGSEIYTDDSSLAACAVHAGILRVGEFGFVRVTMAPGEASYAGTSRNGVVSQDYGAFQGSFRIARAPQPWVIDLPADVADGSGMVSLPALRNQTGVSFSVKVVGSSGTVHGSDVYSDDSAIGAAAVHAGVLRLGETGWVRVTLLPGQDAYSGSVQNGMKTYDGGKSSGSFRVDRGNGGSF
jgi:hypothetical protein